MQKKQKENMQYRNIDKKWFIDLEARNAFSGNKVTASIIKYANGFNHYGLRHVMINNKMIKSYCLRYN